MDACIRIKSMLHVAPLELANNLSTCKHLDLRMCRRLKINVAVVIIIQNFLPVDTRYFALSDVSQLHQPPLTTSLSLDGNMAAHDR